MRTLQRARPELRRSGGDSNTAVGGAGARAQQGRRARARKPSAPWWFVVPGLALYLFVVLVPALQGVGYAFTSWNGLSAPRFTGLANFEKLVHDQAALAAIKQTFLLAIAITVGLTVTGLALALGVRAKIRTRNALRVAFFAPAVLAPVMTGYIWQYILGPYGALNTVLGDLHLTALQADWLGSPSVALWTVAAVIVWQFSGYSMVIFLAGLEAIPSATLEAAEVDGAGPVARLWHITLPLLRPALVINVMLAVLMGMKQFDTVWIMTEGGPGNATQTFVTLIYQDLSSYEDGYGVALALILSVIIVALSLILYRALNRRRTL